jgi:hypothetical protein
MIPSSPFNRLRSVTFTYGAVYAALNFQKLDLTYLFSANAAKLVFPLQTWAARGVVIVDAHIVQLRKCKFEQHVQHQSPSLWSDLHSSWAFLTSSIATNAMYDQVFHIPPD